MARGNAAYDIRTLHDNTARPLERPERLPDAPARERPRRAVKTRLAVAPFTIVGSLFAVALLFLVVFSYVRLYETQSEVSELRDTQAELTAEQQRLHSQFESELDLEAVEARARELGMREPLPSQIVYVEVAAGDSTEVYAAPKERNLFEQIYDAFDSAIRDVVEYFF